MRIVAIVNANARHGGLAAGERLRAEAPSIEVVVTHSMEEAAAALARIVADPPDLVVAAGGDGTAQGVLNLARPFAKTVGAPWIRPDGAPGTVLAAMPLGTGNAWARVTGVKAIGDALAKLVRLSTSGAEMPRRRFDSVEVGGKLTHFAGTGWDAEIIDDFHAQQDAVSVIPREKREGLWGYLNALATRTVPRLMVTRPEIVVEVANTDGAAFTVDGAGQPIPATDLGGGLLYRGPASVCAIGTTSEWGYGFRAFPFAGLVPHTLCVRVYAAKVVEAVLHSRRLWRGEHPMPKMHTFLVKSCRVSVSEPVPFQIGGDRTEHVQTIDYALAKEQVDLLDWSKLA